MRAVVSGSTLGHDRRALALSVGVLVLLAGCPAAGQSTPVAAAGSTVALPAEAVAEAGYDRVGQTEKRLNATLRAELEGDISVTEVVDVRATVPVTRYRRSTPDGPAVVAVAASPSVQLIENPPVSRDPLSTLSTGELVAFVQSTYRPDIVSGGVETDVTVFGNRTDLVTHEARANATEAPVPEDAPLTVRVIRVDHTGDVVTVVSVAPRGRDADLRTLVTALGTSG